MMTTTLFLTCATCRASDFETLKNACCVLIGMPIYNSNNGNQQTAGMWMRLYYMEQLNGRVSLGDLETLLVDEAKTMTSTESALEAKRCGKELSSVASQLTGLGNVLRKR